MSDAKAPKTLPKACKDLLYIFATMLHAHMHCDSLAIASNCTHSLAHLARIVPLDAT